MPRVVDSSIVNWNDGPFTATKVGDLARSQGLDEGSAEDVVVIENVPILDEHDMVLEPTEEMKKSDPDAKPKIVKIDEAVLKYIAKNNNRVYKETGDPAAITIGHTKSGLSEQEQQRHAPIVGWAKNFEVGPFLNTDRKAIHATFYIRAKDWPNVRDNYPRRSIEILPGRWEIDPIALLGATTPERWLGVLQYSRYHKKQVYRREPSGASGMNDMATATDKNDQIIAAIFNNPAFVQGLTQLVHQAMKGGGDKPMDQNAEGDEGLDDLLAEGDDHVPPGAETEPAPADEDMKKVKEKAKGKVFDVPSDEDDEEEDDDDMKKKMAAGMPCATNVAIPATLGNKKKQMSATKFSPEALAAVDAIVKQNLKEKEWEQKLAAMQGEVVKMQREKREAVRLAQLREVQAEGYDFEVAKKLPKVLDMTDEQFADHIEEIKVHYKHAPVKVTPTFGADPKDVQVGVPTVQSAGPQDASAMDQNRQVTRNIIEYQYKQKLQAKRDIDFQTAAKEWQALQQKAAGQ